MKSHPCLLTLAGCLLGAFSLHAADPAAEKSEPASEPYQLKNRSTFNLANSDARAPFWPIGWMPRAGGTGQVEKADTAKLDEKAFRVTSILLGSGATPSLVVINGRAYGEGEFLKMPRGTPEAGSTAVRTDARPAVARIRVQQISDGMVVLQRGTQTVTVALARPELALKKIEDPVLEEEP